MPSAPKKILCIEDDRETASLIAEELGERGFDVISGGGTFAEGSSHTVNATPKGSHSFVNWTQSGRVVSTSASYTFTMPSANAALTAHFK
jgi:hypothetical protein